MGVHLNLTEKDFEKIRETAAFITTAWNKHYTIGELARKIGLPEKRLKYAFKQHYGMGVYSYLRVKRMEKAKAMMLEGEKIKHIVPVIGYHNEGNFSKAFRKVAGVSPTEWKENGY